MQQELEGALIALVSMGVGRFIPNRRKGPKPYKPAPPPKPICGCSHHLSIHDPKTKACNAGVKTPKYSGMGSHIGYTYPPCPCKQYVGPEPTPEYYATEILP